MTEKEKIRKEVARIQLYTQSDVLKQILDYIDSMPDEPVSEELEDAANFYANTHIEYFDSEGNSHVSIAFKAGAQWQKEQALKNAVNAGIYEDGEDHTLHAITVPIDNVKFGERVKVVIIKEESV